LLSDKEINSIKGLWAVTQGILNKHSLNITDVKEILTCIVVLLEDSEIFRKEFLGWLGDLANLPEVQQEAKKYKFGELGVKTFAWAMRKYRQR